MYVGSGRDGSEMKALFTFKFFCKIGIITLSFVFDKYCLIMD